MLVRLVLIVRRLLIFSLCVACGSAGEDETAADEPTSSASDGSTSSLGGSSEGSTAGPTTASELPTSSDDTGSESTSEVGGSFLSDDSTGTCAALPGGVLGHCSKCSFVLQDCGDGFACKPWANDGGGVWNSARCRPLAPEAGLQGEPCNVEAVASSGIDSCGAGLVCLGVQGDKLEGECVSFCGEDSGDFFCEDPGDTCGVYNESNVPLCLPSCDPLEPSCDEGAGCYPGSADDFACLREGERLKVDGLFHPECPSGTFWAHEDQVPGCGYEEPCCTPYCDTSEVLPCGVDVECVSFFGAPDPDHPNLGYCRPDAL